MTMINNTHQAKHACKVRTIQILFYMGWQPMIVIAVYVPK